MTEQRFIDVADGVRVWAEAIGDPGRPALLLVMGANSSAVAWPDELVARLAERHRVIRYDHRDTGRSSRVYDERPYPLTALAGDALAVLDAFGVERAHVVGMSLGGTLTQVLLLDAPERLLSATLFSTGALGGVAGEEDLPGAGPELLALWGQLGDERTSAEQVAFEVEHWRLLSGGAPFDPEEFAALGDRVRGHAGTDVPTFAHALADQSGLERGSELAEVMTPTLIIDATLDPVYPSAHARHLERVIGGARRVEVAMGHALPTAIVPDLADAILTHTRNELSAVGRQGATLL